MLRSILCKYVKGHAQGKSHKLALLTWERQQRCDASISESIMQLQQKMGMQGSLLNQETKLFRMKCVQLMFKAKMSAQSLDSVGAQLKTWAGAPMGGGRALMEYDELHHIT
jgi:hypothetical protein